MSEHQSSKRPGFRAKRRRREAPRPRPRRKGGHIEPTAGFRGRPIAGTTFRQNGKLKYAADFDDPFDEKPVAEQERSRLPFLLRLVAAEIAKYRKDEVCTEKELRTIEALWREGLSLREHARREGVRPQAIVCRIARLERRATRFWNWWRLKNRMRTRR